MITPQHVVNIVLDEAAKIGGADETIIGKASEILGITIVGHAWAILPTSRPAGSTM